MTIASRDRSAPERERLLAIAERLADKQREVDALHGHIAGVVATRGWKVLTVFSLSYRLLLFQPAAYHQARHLARRVGQRIKARLRARVRAATGAPPPPPDTASLYAEWRAANEPDAAQLAAQRRISVAWTDRPLVSVVSPVFAPPADALADLIASVCAQTYDRWELVLVLAGPQPDAVVEAVRAGAAADARIVVVELDANRGIAGNTNAGLARAHGSFVAFLDHDDQLAPNALFEVSRVLRDEPDVDVVTFDEDKIAPDGRTRIDPLVKPSMSSPEHLLSINDRMHSVVRKASIDRVGGVASGVDGAQDWDLALRLLEAGARARHVPTVLYHWRMVPGSAAGDAMAKPWAYDAQRIALREHLERQGLRDVEVEHPRVGVVRVRWRASGERVSIIIPTKDKAGLLETCLRSIRERTSYGNYEILVVDTGSREPATARLYERLAGDSAIRILRDDAPFNFSRVNNLAARQATGRVLVFLNNDIEAVDPDWLEELVRWTDRPEIGCVGPKLVYPNGTLQHAGLIAGLGGHGSAIYQEGPAAHTWGVFGSVDFYRNYLMLGGACLAVRRDVFEALGGFDEQYVLCYNDLDLCLRAAETGYRNVYTPFARLVHHEGGTRGRHFPPGDVLRASIRMFPLVVQGDPYYSRNLSFREREPTLTAADDPSARADVIRHIARLFNVQDELAQALRDELLGRTSDWRGFERLLHEGAARVPIAASQSRRERVLFVSHDLSRSGAPMVMVHLARAFVAEGREVVVLAPAVGRLREDFEEAGARVIVDPKALEAPYALSTLFDTFDAIVANTILSWRAVLAARAAGKPVVWLIHESRFGVEYARNCTGAIQAMAIADEVVFPSRETLGMYRSFDSGNFSSETYGLVPPPPAPLPEPFERDRFHLLILASVESRKGQDILVEALRRLPRGLRKTVVLHLVGRVLDAAFAAMVRSLAAPLDIRWHGEVSPEQAIGYLAAADALVCASRDDPSPVVVLEAMALGKAIVSTRVGAIPDLLEDGVSGLLVTPLDAAGLSRTIARLVGDPEVRRRLGNEARRMYEERLSPERFGRAMLDRVSRAIASNQDTPAQVTHHRKT